jgi:hypothetical protein
MLLAGSMKAQDKKLYSFVFNNLSQSAVLDSISSSTRIKIFYDPYSMDTVKKTTVVRDVTIDQLLMEVLKGTSLNFYLTNRDEIFIVDKSYQIVTQLNIQESSKERKASQIVLESISAEAFQDKKTDVQQLENKLIEVGSKQNPTSASKIVLAGYVKDINSGVGIVGATVYAVAQKQGVVTDAFGFFSIK